MTETCCTLEIVAGSQDIPTIDLDIDSTVIEMEAMAVDPIALAIEVEDIGLVAEIDPVELAFVVQGEQGIQGIQGEKGDAGASGGGILASEVPDGVVNGVNREFNLQHEPVANSLLLFVNGLLQIGYSVSSSTITFDADNIPTTGDDLFARYQYEV